VQKLLFSKNTACAEQIILIIQKLVIVAWIVRISFMRVRAPSNFPCDARASKDTEFLSPAKRAHERTHEFFSQTRIGEGHDDEGICVFVMPNKRLVRPRRMFSTFQAPKSRGILDSVGLFSPRIVTVPTIGGWKPASRRSDEKKWDGNDDERGKTRKDAGCAAMKRGTGDVKGRQGGRGTRRTVNENCLKSSDI